MEPQRVGHNWATEHAYTHIGCILVDEYNSLFSNWSFHCYTVSFFIFLYFLCFRVYLVSYEFCEPWFLVISVLPNHYGRSYIWVSIACWKTDDSWSGNVPSNTPKWALEPVGLWPGQGVPLPLGLPIVRPMAPWLMWSWSHGRFSYFLNTSCSLEEKI